MAHDADDLMIYFVLALFNAKATHYTSGDTKTL